MFLEYLKKNPVLTAILVACAAIILIVLIVMIARSVKAGKRRQAKASGNPAAPETARKNAQSENIIAPEAEPATTRDLPAYEAEPEEIKSETQPTAEQKEEPLPPPQETSETNTEPTKNVAAAEKDIPAEEEPKSEKTSIELKEEKAEAKNICREKEDKQEERKEETSAAKEPDPAEREESRKKENREPKKGKNKSKEGKMNIDDLKNALVDEDFYDEEDEDDKIARYSGKWVICRVLTVSGKGDDDLTEGNAAEETFFFELHASNGEKLLTSEEYTTYNGALNGIETHKANIERGNFKIMLSKKGDYIFKLLSGKNMLLCMGEHYATKARCESAIESAKRFAKTAIVDESIQDIVITPPPEDEDEAIAEIPDNGYNGKWIIRAHTADDGEQVFYFELFASNGEKLLSSEEYTTYIGAINGIGTHKSNIQRGNFRISLTKRGDYIYKLLNGNGQLLCLGEHYKTKRRCESAIESVKRFAKNAPILSDPETVNKNA